jgi:hypothetical protein
MIIKETIAMFKEVINNSSFAAWATAFATFILAIVAIFQDKIRARIKRPELNAEINCSPPDCHKTKYKIMISDNRSYRSADSYFFRMRIINNGNEKAENVEVYAYKLERKSNDKYKELKWFLPLNLGWTHYGTPFIEAISPKMEKHCDLGVVINPQSRKDFEKQNLDSYDSNKTILSLSVLIYPNTLSHLLKEGDYRLYLKIASSNTEPIDKILRIVLDGYWSDNEEEMLRDHIKLSFL